MSAALPQSQTPRRRSVARWSPTGAVAITFLALVTGWLVVLATFLIVGDRDVGWIDGAALVLADAATLAVIVFFARRGAEKLGPETFGLRRTDATAAFGWALLAYIAYGGFAGLWAVIVGGGDEGGGGATSAESLGPIAIALMFLGVAITAPIVEEVAFRGYLFAALTRWRGPWLAAIVSGLFFGAAHVLVHPPAVLLPIAIMGFLLAMVFWITGSLLPCIALHAANNALVISLSVGWSWQVPIAVIGMAAIAVAIVAALSRERVPQAQPAG
jgi:membrane protease YdiL (CAAX protease family)